MRNLLLILVLATAAGAVAWMAMSEPEDEQVAVQRTGQVETDREVPRDPGPELAPSNEGRSEAARGARAILEVDVVDPKGGRLPDARVRVEGPEGVLEGPGKHVWSELLPGTYDLHVTHASYPDWTRSVDLEGDRKTRLLIQLREEIELKGKIVDRFGTSIPGQQVWFLKPGQRHPYSVESARDALGAVADRDGKVKVTLPHGGQWQLSVGRVGSEDLIGPRRELTHGGASNFVAVVSGATRLDLDVQFPDGPESLTAIVMQRREDAVADRGASSGTERKDDPAQQERIEKAFSRGDAGMDLVGPDQPVRSDALPDWVNRMSRAVGNDGHVTFQHLLPGREYRLAIVRSGERYESQTSFLLKQDELLTITAHVPAAQGPSDEPLVAPLNVSLRHGVPSDQNLKPGIHWQ